MKKQLTIISILFISITLNAQWVDTNTNNNVGIGITNLLPSVKLLVQGDANWATFYSKNLSFNGHLEVLNSGGGGLDAPQINIFDNGNNSIFHVGGDGQRFMYYNGGNFGIGTNSPQAKLQIGNMEGADKRIMIPGAYNFEQLNLTMGGNGNGELEFVTHSNGTNSGGIKLLSPDGAHLYFQTATPTNSYSGLNYQTKMILTNDGSLGIGAAAIDSKLTVGGDIHSREVKVTINAGSDFVFNDTYHLRKLNEVEAFIKQNKHLPDVESAKEMEVNGLELGKMDMKLLQKIEELTLYAIDFKKELDKVKEENQKLRERVAELEKK